ncbi:unnamed protein product [Prorocentrum cordatum]|uniref:Reverse transcriptase domain-containing protein n=1 Tax=Prorocentrum cordatum TaxID=2364126 RepID=A0ABN9T8C2_9DINO|nr:unnamed protein product [Polarella glacialis]
MVSLVRPEALQRTPSWEDGVSRAAEAELRVFGVELIQRAAALLRLPQTTTASAAVVFQRFYFRRTHGVAPPWACEGKGGNFATKMQCRHCFAPAPKHIPAAITRASRSSPVRRPWQRADPPAGGKAKGKGKEKGDKGKDKGMAGPAPRGAAGTAWGYFGAGTDLLKSKAAEASDPISVLDKSIGTLESLADPSLGPIIEAKRAERASLVAQKRAGKPLHLQLQALEGKMAAAQRKLARQRDEVVPELQQRLAEAQRVQEAACKELEQLQEEKAQLARRVVAEEQAPAGAAGPHGGGPHCGQAVISKLVANLGKLVGDTEGDGDSVPKPLVESLQSLLKLVKSSADGDGDAVEEQKRKRDELVGQYLSGLPEEERAAKRAVLGRRFDGPTGPPLIDWTTYGDGQFWKGEDRHHEEPHGVGFPEGGGGAHSGQDVGYGAPAAMDRRLSPVVPIAPQATCFEGRSQHVGRDPAEQPQRRRRTRRGDRHVIAATFNANLSWARVEEFMEEEIEQIIKRGGVPIVAVQEHAKPAEWFNVTAAAQERRGWRVVGAPAVRAAEGGHSAGVALITPRCLSLSLAPGQASWDISPAGAAGRLCLAMTEVKGIGWMALLSVYLFTGKPVTWAPNAALLDTIVHWVCQMRIPWMPMGDFNNEPRAILDSPWNQEAKGQVLAWQGEGGTCRSKVVKQGVEEFKDRVIDFFWVDARLAVIFCPVKSLENMPCRPRRPTWIRADKPWHACQIQVLKGPKQYPITRPPPVRQPEIPQGYPKINLLHGSQQHLDQCWRGFCSAAEAELRSLFGWTELEARRYEGRGLTPEVVQRQLLPKHDSPVADRGPARAWRWAAGELAWIGQLVCCVLRGQSVPMAKAEASAGQNTTSGEGPPRSYNEEVKGQLRRAWRKLFQARHHWDQMEPWSAGFLPTLRILSDVEPHFMGAQAIFALQQFAKVRAQTWEQHLMRQRSKRVYERLSAKFPGSGGYLHRICHWKQAWKEPISSAKKRKLPSDPQLAVNQEAQEWAGIWRAGSGDYTKLWQDAQVQAQRMAHVQELPITDAVQVRAICRSYKWKTGLGLDGWHFGHLAWLSDEALTSLGDILMLCERLCSWPTAMRMLILFLVAKEDGGGRPITLFPTPVRIWEAVRDPLVRRWERAHVRPYDWASPGRSSEHAVWRAMLDDEALEGTCFASLTALVDLEKAYEYVALNLIWIFGLVQHAPMSVLALSLESYAFPRAVRKGHAVADAICTYVGLPAGSKYASRFLKIVLYPILDVVARWPGAKLEITKFVDDLALRMVGRNTQLKVIFPDLARTLIHLLESLLQLEVSKGEGGKSKFVSSDVSLAQELAQPMADIGLQHGESERWLGVDYQPQGPRKKATRARRFKTVRGRWHKAAALKRRGVRIRPVVQQGLKASVAYGATCAGTPPAVLKFVMAKAAAVRAGAGTFRSGTLGWAIAPRTDGAEQLRLAPLRAWAREAWDQPERRKEMAHARGRQWPKVQRALTYGPAKFDAWKMVRGPAAATILTVHELGWHMKDAWTILDGVHCKWDIREVAPLEILRSAERAVAKKKLMYWVLADEERQPLRPAPFLLPVKQLMRSKPTGTWTRHHINSVRTVALGGYPVQTVCYERGQVTSPLCPLCGKKRGTLLHVYFLCDADVRVTIRDGLTEPTLKHSFRDVVHLGETAATKEEQGCRGGDALFWKWARGLIADPVADYQVPTPPDECQWGDPDGEMVLSGWVATDGRVLAPDVEEVSTGGFAAITWSAEKKSEVQSLFGAVPVARPTSAHCEIWAVYQGIAAHRWRKLYRDRILDGKNPYTGKPVREQFERAALAPSMWPWLADRGASLALGYLGRCPAAASCPPCPSCNLACAQVVCPAAPPCPPCPVGAFSAAAPPEVPAAPRRPQAPPAGPCPEPASCAGGSGGWWLFLLGLLAGVLLSVLARAAWRAAVASAWALVAPRARPADAPALADEPPAAAVAPAGLSEWICSTPDLNIQFIDVTTHRVIPLTRDSEFPRRARGEVYAFDPLTPEELQQVRKEAKELLAVYGLTGGADAQPEGGLWLIADPAHPGFGDALPAAALADGDSLIIRGDRGLACVDEDWVAVERVLDEDLDNWRLLKSTGAGRDSSKALRPGWRFRGDACAPELVMALVAAGIVFITHHLDWRTKSGVSTTSGVCRTHRRICEGLDQAICNDQLDFANCAVIEHLARWLYEVESAVRRNPKVPDFANIGGIFAAPMAEDGRMQLPTFSKWVSSLRRDEAQIMKQERLWSEGRGFDRAKRKGKGGKGPGAVAARAIWSLSALDAPSRALRAHRPSSSRRLSEAQRSIIARVSRRVENHGERPDILPSTAYADLIKSHDLYSGQPMNLKPSSAAAWGQGRRYLDNADELIFRTEAELGALQESELIQPIAPYWDPILKNNRRARIDFIKRLASVGLVGFGLSIRGRVGAFCVGKKGGFCQFANDDLADWFGFNYPEAAPDFGDPLVCIPADVRFVQVSSDARIFAVFRGVLMGWSWSLFFCRDLLGEAQCKGLLSLGCADGSRLVHERRPAPLQAPGRPLSQPYVDDANVIGLHFSDTEHALRGIQHVLDYLGIDYHDLVEPAKLCTTVGVVLDTTAVPSVSCMATWSTTCGRRSRPALAALDEGCRFIAQRLDERAPLGRHLLDELRVVKGLLMLADVDLAAPWSRVAYCSDASGGELRDWTSWPFAVAGNGGYALHETACADDEVMQAFKYRKRWRFKMAEEELVAPGAPRDGVRGWAPEPAATSDLLVAGLLAPCSKASVIDRRLPRARAVIVQGAVPALGDSVGGLGDNMAALLSFEKGRAWGKALLQLCLVSAAWQIGCEIQGKQRYCESGRNPTDADSRAADLGHVLPDHPQRGCQRALADIESANAGLAAVPPGPPARARRPAPGQPPAFRPARRPRVWLGSAPSRGGGPVGRARPPGTQRPSRLALPRGPRRACSRAGVLGPSRGRSSRARPRPRRLVGATSDAGHFASSTRAPAGRPQDTADPPTRPPRDAEEALQEAREQLALVDGKLCEVLSAEEVEIAIWPFVRHRHAYFSRWAAARRRMVCACKNCGGLFHLQRNGIGEEVAAVYAAPGGPPPPVPATALLPLREEVAATHHGVAAKIAAGASAISLPAGMARPALSGRLLLEAALAAPAGGGAVVLLAEEAELRNVAAWLASSAPAQQVRWLAVDAWSLRQTLGARPVLLGTPGAFDRLVRSGRASPKDAGLVLCSCRSGELPPVRELVEGALLSALSPRPRVVRRPQGLPAGRRPRAA